MIAQALSDDKDDLIVVIVKPAIEKTRSDGAEVAGIHNMRFAKRLNRGKVDAFFSTTSVGWTTLLFHYLSSEIRYEACCRDNLLFPC